ncbi:aminotransferase class V-fold PLP-dependent enzyme [Paenarthrobacter sp. DKR-5]|uniref:aminotransferase class V-fold PLP-dependent enzyme n=1 Tax=Paenarthrobacter sp. DKR-5 TaxID=2835535 RepID=UPI001BDCEF4D|nr:aminotransferase class V-fold PLP-dependent enzyme [Paenarthrobacter sp. DKR-5]MBT1001654.1 aminotransferase class V-fold PLP-dependent enzyme [Paenarthrobacter sp. DKR-5]
MTAEGRDPRLQHIVEEPKRFSPGGSRAQQCSPAIDPATLGIRVRSMKSVSEKRFFNFATVAPMSRTAYDAAQTFLADFYHYGPPEALYRYDSLAEQMAAEAARLVNCAPEEITYLKNTTEGIIIASEALPLERGDEVLVLGNEYPANLLPWLRKRHHGVTVSVITGRDNKDAFRRLVESIGPHTKAISISSAQRYDGFMPDLPLLSEVCRGRGIFLVIDAVQHVGVRTIDLKKTPVDFLVCGGQKYLRAGMGIGFMYVSREVMPVLRDSKVGIRSVQQFDENSYVLRETAARFQDGTQNVSGLAALHAALKEINTAGMDAVQQKNLAILEGIKCVLHEHELEFIDHGAHQGNIVSIPTADPSALSRFLAERGVYIKAIEDVARISFIHESKLEDVEVLARHAREFLGGAEG